MQAHTHANTHTEDTHTHTHKAWDIEERERERHIHAAAGHCLRWTHHSLTDRGNGREESGMKGGRQKGGRLAFSSALEEFVLAAKLSPIFFFPFPFFSSSPLSFLIRSTLFLHPNQHLSNQSGHPLLCPPSIFSFSLHNVPTITFHLCSCPSIQGLIVVF